MQRFVFVPMVATFSCLFCGVQAFCVKCQNSSQLFFVLFSIWCPSIIIDGHASSDQSPGLMAIKVHCFSCLSFIWVLWVRCRHISSLHHVCDTWCMRRVKVIFNVFSFFLLCGNGRKDYHNCFITTGLSGMIINKKKHMISYWQSGA